MEKGSKLHIQTYVNTSPERLNDALKESLDGLSDATIRWVSPLESDGYREYWDLGFLRRLGLEAHADALARFWPVGGPHWDALATVSVDGSGRRGAVLVEAKAHPAELFSSGSQASDPASIAAIDNALESTQRWIGVAVDGEAWRTSRLYQTANRLAHLYWLNEVVGVRAWLAHVLFCDDESHRSTTADAWHAAVDDANRELGLAGVAIPKARHVLLPALN